jgi:hypothetical protein
LNVAKDRFVLTKAFQASFLLKTDSFITTTTTTVTTTKQQQHLHLHHDGLDASSNLPIMAESSLYYEPCPRTAPECFQPIERKMSVNCLQLPAFQPRPKLGRRKSSDISAVTLKLLLVK